jgi:hypothetical protein
MDQYEYILSQEEMLQEPMDKISYENANNLKLVANVNLLMQTIATNLMTLRI